MKVTQVHIKIELSKQAGKLYEFLNDTIKGVEFSAHNASFHIDPEKPSGPQIQEIEDLINCRLEFFKGKDIKFKRELIGLLVVMDSYRDKYLFFDLVQSLDATENNRQALENLFSCIERLHKKCEDQERRTLHSYGSMSRDRYEERTLEEINKKY